MTQKTHYNEETLVRYLRAALQHLRTVVDLENVYGANGVEYHLDDALSDLNEQFPELTPKEKKFLDVIRATQPWSLSHAKELLTLGEDAPVPKKQAHGAKEASYRKTGPGRYAVQGDGSRTVEQKRAGAFARGLRNNITRKQAAAL